MSPFSVPLPTAESVAWALLFVLAGMTVPTGYGIERLNGFGRAVLSKLPYQSPPGVDEQEAMQAATDYPTDDQDDVEEEGDG